MERNTRNPADGPRDREKSGASLSQKGMRDDWMILDALSCALFFFCVLQKQMRTIGPLQEAAAFNFLSQFSCLILFA